MTDPTSRECELQAALDNANETITKLKAQVESERGNWQRLFDRYYDQRARDKEASAIVKHQGEISGKDAARLSVDLAHALESNRKLKREVTLARENNEKRNRELDALHFVWCDGGCHGGTHRWTEKNVTHEIVAAAIVNTSRLWRWYVNHCGKEQPAGVDRTPFWEDAKKRILDAVGAQSLQKMAELDGANETIARLQSTLDTAEQQRDAALAEVDRLRAELTDLRVEYIANLGNWGEEEARLKKRIAELEGANG